MVCVGDEPARRRAVRAHRLLQRAACSGQRVRDAVIGALDSMTLAELARPRPRHPVPRPDPVLVADRAAQPAQPDTKESIAERMNPATSATLHGRRAATVGRVTQPADDRELVIRDLHVVPVADPKREILRGIDLTVRKGEVHAIMGRNGSGKTTLAYALMGHPAYHGHARRGPSGRASTSSRCRPTSAPGWASSSPSSTPPPIPGLSVAASCARRSTPAAAGSTAATASSTRPTRPAAASAWASSARSCARRWRC